MRNMSLSNIAKACGGAYHGSEEQLQTIVENVTIDSRKVEKGSLFIATKGERVNGHDFIGQSMEKGAVCVICERPLTEADIPSGMELCYIQVQDSFQALKDIAAFYRQQFTIPVIGITGSVGKTSTKEMIGGVLSAKYKVLKTDGNFNNEIGMPLTILRLRDEHEVAVLEMGISAFGEMSRLTRIARPDICVITNIGQCHLENLGTRDGVLKAKTEIFEGLSTDGYAVLNGADDKLITVRGVHGRKPVFFDCDDCYATDVVNRGLFGTDCVIHADGDQIRARIRVPGSHQVVNAMAAVRVAGLLGMTKKEIERGIESVEAIGGRNHIVEGISMTLIDDCYNANPASMKAALDLLDLALGRKVAVLGDMYELGEKSDELHREVGAYVAQTDCDVLIGIGKSAGLLCDSARQQENPKLSVLHYDTKEDFLAESHGLLKKHDTILLKASHGMHFETLLETLRGM